VRGRLAVVPERPRARPGIAQLPAREGASVVLGDIEPAGLDTTAASITAAGGAAPAVAGDQRANLSRAAADDVLVDAWWRAKPKGPGTAPEALIYLLAGAGFEPAAFEL
jgi:hypothetical protein